MSKKVMFPVVSAVLLSSGVMLTNYAASAFVPSGLHFGVGHQQEQPHSTGGGFLPFTTFAQQGQWLTSNNIVARPFRDQDQQEEETENKATRSKRSSPWFIPRLIGQQPQQQPDEQQLELAGDGQEDFLLWVSNELKRWPFLLGNGSFPFLSENDVAWSKMQLSATEKQMSVALGSVADKVSQGGGATSTNITSSSSFFLFSELWNVASLLGTAQNVGAAAAAERLLKQLTDRVPTAVDLPSFLDWAREMAVSDRAQNGLQGSRFSSIVADTTREYAARLLSVTDGLLSQGYVNGDPLAGTEKAILDEIHDNDNAGDEEQRSKKSTSSSEALFARFKSAVELNEWSPEVENLYKMARLASTIYNKDDSVAVSELSAQGESVVATGTTANVKWFVTDSTQVNGQDQQPERVRTITLRGFDASDESVDRQELFRTICTAQPETLRLGKKKPQVLVHSGLYRLGEHLYHCVLKPYLFNADSPEKIVLVGHSIGGALSTMLLLWTTMDQGVDFATRRIQKLYTFGAPPVATTTTASLSSRQERRPRRRAQSKQGKTTKNEEDLRENCHCDVLSAFGLPSTIVQGYVQPWDPIPRLFSAIDPVYPLIGEIDMEHQGDDGMVLWPRGPPRALRSVTTAIVEAWGEGWVEFRDDFRKNCNQTYTTVGVQHIYLPEPKRYLTDRFMVAGVVDIAVPPVQTIVRLSSQELYPALSIAFPLDVFEISYIPQAIRSFVHHFYPAYVASIVDYLRRLRRDRQDLDVEQP